MTHLMNVNASQQMASSMASQQTMIGQQVVPQSTINLGAHPTTQPAVHPSVHGAGHAVGHAMSHPTGHAVSHPSNSVQSMSSQPQTMSTQSAEQRYDLIARVRALVWSLKESLASLMRVAASNIQHNSQIDSGLKISEEQVPRFDKALEDFFSICNQIELHLKTILECAIQARDSQQYLPFPVSSIKTDNVVENSSDNAISYTQYLITIKSQVNFAKTVHDMLIDGAKRIGLIDVPINQVMSSNNSSNTSSVV